MGEPTAYHWIAWLSACAISGYRCIGGLFMTKGKNIKGNSSKEHDECVLYFALSIQVQVLERLRVYAS